LERPRHAQLERVLQALLHPRRDDRVVSEEESATLNTTTFTEAAARTQLVILVQAKSKATLNNVDSTSSLA
jgi:hypothetical protein